MSLPFMQPYMGLGNSLQTAQGGAAGGIGGWVELGRTTLGSNGTIIDIASLANKRYYMVLVNKLGLASANGLSQMRLNADTGSNYAWRRNNDGAGEASTGSQSSIDINSVTNSEAVVLGWDPADTHTSNFWEELASVDLSGGAADILDSGTFTAKKYLWWSRCSY
jgi:hypothetical protein